MVPERICRLLTAYVDGELDAHKRKVVEQLLRQSSQARELFRGFQQDAERLRGLPCPTLGPDFSEHILQTLASRKVEPARHSVLTVRYHAPAWLRLATAAAVLLVVGIRSYVSFVAVDQPPPEEVVLHDPRPAAPPEVAETNVVVAAAVKPSERELLAIPAPESEAKPSSAPIANMVAGNAPPEPKPLPVLASPIRENDVHWKDPDVRIDLVFNLRDFKPEHGKHLGEELQKRTAHTLELRCAHTVAGMERLLRAFQSQGIPPVIDRDAQAVLKLGMGKNTTFALYCEDITAAEIVTVLQQVSGEDRSAEAKRTGWFESLSVDGMVREEQQKLWRLFAMDPARVEAPLAERSADAQIRKPPSPSLPENTVRALQQDGISHPELAKSALKPLNRRALVTAYPSGRPRAVSTEAKRFLDNPKERAAGTLQIILVISATKN